MGRGGRKWEVMALDCLRTPEREERGKKPRQMMVE